MPLKTTTGQIVDVMLESGSAMQLTFCPGGTGGLLRDVIGRELDRNPCVDVHQLLRIDRGPRERWRGEQRQRDNRERNGKQ